jgi:hypothetical protein
VRGVIVAVSILGMLGSLMGCDSKPVYEDTSALENPPPKPPHCPDLPELANVTLKDGSIADVRIVEIADTKLYVPTAWMKSHFVDGEFRNSGGFIYKSILEWFAPDIHSVECPGVVHKFNQDKTGFSFWLADFVRNEYQQNISPKSSLSMISIFKRHPQDIDRLESRGEGGVTAYVIANTGITISYVIPTNAQVGSKTWGSYRDSTRRLIQWLSLAPMQRDNEMMFTLGGDRR